MEERPAVLENPPPVDPAQLAKATQTRWSATIRRARDSMTSAAFSTRPPTYASMPSAAVSAACSGWPVSLQMGESEAPPVHGQHRWVLRRHEPLGLCRAEVDLPVHHGGVGAVDGQHPDAWPRERRSNQRQRAGRDACLDDRRQPRVVGADQRRVQLVPGQRQLRKDHYPRTGTPYDRGLRLGVRAHVVRHQGRLGDRDHQRAGLMTSDRTRQ